MREARRESMHESVREAPVSAPSDGSVKLEGLAAGGVEEGQLAQAALPNGTKVCVGRFQGTCFVVKDSCPHSEFPLSEGTLYPNGELECSWHGARFNCVTGAVLQGPADDDLVRFDVTEVDGALWVKRAPRD